jgi:hypothetical protein
MRTFFKKLGDGVVSTSISVASHIGGTIVNAGSAFMTGIRFIDNFVKASWADAKASWNANHGVRAVLGFAVSLLAIPVVLVAAIIAPVAILTVGLVVIPVLVVGLVAGVIAFAAIICLWAGLLTIISWTASKIYKTEETTESESKNVAAEAIEQVVTGAAEAATA